MIIVVSSLLFADAEFAEYVAENIVSGDLARDRAKIVQYLSDLLTDQIRRQTPRYTCNGPVQSLRSMQQSLVMADIAHYQAVVRNVSFYGLD